jgi:hypothetical protein
VNETPEPADVLVHFEMSLSITGFGVEKATSLSVVPPAAATPVKANTGMKSERRRNLRM